MTSPIVLPRVRFFTTGGAPLAGGKLYTYLAGTTTPKTTYSDYNGATPNANPIILDANGEATVYLSDDAAYKFLLQNSANVTQWTEDNVTSVQGQTVTRLASTSSASNGAGMVGFSYSLNYAVSTLGWSEKYQIGIDVTQHPYLADRTGATDCAAAINACWAANPGIPMRFPRGTYRVDSEIDLMTSSFVGSFGPGPKIYGEGIGVTIFDNRVASGYLFDIDSETGDSHATFKGLLGVELHGFTIKTTTSPASSSGIRLRTSYMARLSQLHITGLTGSGIVIPCLVGDNDGSNMVQVDQVRIENCAGWGVNAAGDSGYNETSFIQCRHLFVQACGTNGYKTITGVTQANPGVVTAASHGFENGDVVVIFGINGMTELNGNYYTVANKAANTFELSGTNTSGYGAYTSGGECAPSEPTSGGMKWKGQILTLDQCAFTLNYGAPLFIPGQNGLAQSVYIEATTFENNLKRGGPLVTGIANFVADIYQTYNNDGNQAYVQTEFYGNTYGIENVDIRNPIVRASSGNSKLVAFKIHGSNAVLNTCRVRSNAGTWDNFDYAGQTRFSGWLFDYVHRGCQMVVSGPTLVEYKPRSAAPWGRSTPYRLRSSTAGNSTTGEWVEYQIVSTGVSINNTGLSTSTTYYVYLYDAGTPTLELSTTAPAQDTASGYMVKTGDATRYYVGAVRTDSAGSPPPFLTSATGWLNPEIVYDGSSQSGVPYYRWRDSTGDLRVSNAAPTSDTDGTVVGTQT